MPSVTYVFSFAPLSLLIWEFRLRRNESSNRATRDKDTSAVAGNSCKKTTDALFSIPELRQPT
jgi:hypothetical protein